MTPPEAAPAPITVWISSMNRIAPGLLLQFRDHALEALLEIAAVLGAGDERAHVQRVDGAVGQHLRHLVLDDQQRQAFGHGGLADAGFADEQRVVLAAPAEDLDGALDLVLAADQRIDAPFPRQLVEVGGVHLERAAALRIALLVVLAPPSLSVFSSAILEMPWEM